MPRNNVRQTADILPFPIGGRSALAENVAVRREAKAALPDRVEAVPDFGGWYHEAAIEEAEQTCKH